MTSHRLTTLLLLSLLGSIAMPALAACDTGLAERMHAKLHPKRSLDHERAVCQPWRGVPGRFIVVLPLRDPASTDASTRFDLDVLVVQQADNGNTERAVVVSRSFQPAALEEDAVRITDIRVDGARYLLGPNLRAFGLRVGYQGSSRANPYSRETLSLFVPEGARLIKVLDDLEMTLERGEWDTNCTGNFEIVRGTLAVLRSTSRGHADLQLREGRSATRSVAQGDECITREQPAAYTSRVLRFDGSAYRAGRASSSD